MFGAKSMGDLIFFVKLSRNLFKLEQLLLSPALYAFKPALYDKIFSISFPNAAIHFNFVQCLC